MTAAAATASLERQLVALVGEAYVASPATTVTVNGAIPGFVVEPISAEEVAAVLELANRDGLVVAPEGGGTKQDVGRVPERVDILLRTTRLNKLEHYDPGDLTVGAGAGMTFAELQQTLAGHQQWLPFDAARLDRATIGGLMATGAAGPLKSAFGGMRDFCIGVQFATADGKVAKGGGRVVKNVAGYDLMKLLIGSYGSLAVITKANFKVFPKPRQTRTFVCEFGSLEEALRFRGEILRSPLTPLCLELISPEAVAYMLDRPSTSGQAWQVVLRAAGSDRVLARYAQDVGPAVSRTLEGLGEERLWSSISHFEHGVLGRHANAMLMCTHLAIEDVGGVLQAMEQAARGHAFLLAALGRAATGNLTAAFIPLSVDTPAGEPYAACVATVRSLLPPGSSAEVVHCPREAKRHVDVWGTTPTDIAMMKAVKRAMDPNNILNRGRFIV